MKAVTIPEVLHEIVESFKWEFLTVVSGFERKVREELADGKEHITERGPQRGWQDRAEE